MTGSSGFASRPERKAPRRSKKAPPRARKSARKPTAAKKSKPSSRAGIADKDRTAAKYKSEAGRDPAKRCRCGDRCTSKCNKTKCPNFGIPKLGPYHKYYHPQWMLDRRP